MGLRCSWSAYYEGYMNVRMYLGGRPQVTEAVQEENIIPASTYDTIRLLRTVGTPLMEMGVSLNISRILKNDAYE